MQQGGQEADISSIRVAKWHGLGNDYLIMAAHDLPVPLQEEAVRLLCDRHRGVGSDGLLLWAPPTGAVPGAVARMRVFNPDGSEAEMCGNGIRMFARYLAQQGVVGDSEFVVETLAGPVAPRMLSRGLVRVDMGQARFRSYSIAFEGEGDVVDADLEVKDRRYRFTFVDVGNPHCVILLDDPSLLASLALAEVGPEIEHHSFFPNRVNVEFVCLEADGSVSMRVWERGAGETQACGTGATAVGAACVRLGLAQSPITVHLLGGDLVIEVQELEHGERYSLTPTYHVFMTGPAEGVFEATLSPDLLRRLGWLSDDQQRKTETGKVSGN